MGNVAVSDAGLRVLFFRGLCDTGGVSSWMLSLEQELRSRGAHCAFFFCEGSSRLAEFQRVAPTTVAPIDVLLDLVETERYDVLHIASGDPEAEILALVPMAPRIVATNHGAPSSVWNASNCHALTAVSRGMAAIDQVLTDLEVEPIYNGIDSDHFAPDPECPDRSGPGPIVAWVGRTTSIDQKDFPRFLRVGAILAERGVRLWVADAHGADRSFFEQRGYAVPHIERWHRVEYGEMPQFYRDVAGSGGLVLMTSPMEGFGLVAAEAAACGLTTVAPDVIGLQEVIVADITGTLYPLHATDDEVADIVTGWIAQWNPDRSRNAAVSARERFSLRQMTDRYLEAYSRKQPRRAGKEVLLDPASVGAAIRIHEQVRRRMLGMRVYALSNAALRLSTTGRRWLALRILAHLARIAPRWILKRAPQARVLRTLFNVVNPLTSRPR